MRDSVITADCVSDLQDRPAARPIRLDTHFKFETLDEGEDSCYYVFVRRPDQIPVKSQSALNRFIREFCQPSSPVAVS